MEEITKEEVIEAVLALIKMSKHIREDTENFWRIVDTTAYEVYVKDSTLKIVEHGTVLMAVHVDGLDVEKIRAAVLENKSNRLNEILAGCF